MLYTINNTEKKSTKKNYQRTFKRGVKEYHKKNYKKNFSQKEIIVFLSQFLEICLNRQISPMMAEK